MILSLCFVGMFAVPHGTQAGVPVNKVVKTLKAGTRAFGIVCAADNEHVYVAGAYGDIVVIDNNKVSTTYNSGGYGNSVSLTPNGSTLYIADAYFNNVYAVATANGAVTIVQGPAGGANVVAVTLDGTQFWVGASNGSGTGIFIGDTSSNQLNTTPITLPGNPFGIVFTPDGTQAYVAYASDDVDYLALINVSTHTVVNSNVGGGDLQANGWNGPHNMTMSPSGKDLYITEEVPSAVDNVMVSLNLTTDAANLIYTSPSSEYIDCQGITPKGNYLYIGLQNTEVLSINPTNGTAEGPAVPISGNPSAVAVRPDGKFIYAAYNNSDADSFVTVIKY
jgi:DNA-binding beta-propeller fold protein YncE